MTIGKGADEIDLYYFGRGHTNGDAWVVFPALRVVHAGDIFSGKNLPLLDANNGGSGVDDRRHAGEGRQAASRTSTPIITGHSTMMTMADLAEYAEFNKDFLNDVQAGEEGRQDRRRHRRQLEDAGEVQGLRRADRRSAARLKANVQIVLDETK